MCTHIYIQRINVCIIVESMKECWLASLEVCTYRGAICLGVLGVHGNLTWPRCSNHHQQPKDHARHRWALRMWQTQEADGQRPPWTWLWIRGALRAHGFYDLPMCQQASIAFASAGSQESSRQGWLGCVQWQRMTSTSLAFLSTGCIAPNSPVGGLLSRDFWAHTVCENMFQSFIEAALSSSNYMLSIATRTKHYPSSSSHWLAEGPLHWATQKAKWLQMVWQTAR